MTTRGVNKSETMTKILAHFGRLPLDHRDGVQFSDLTSVAHVGRQRPWGHRRQVPTTPTGPNTGAKPGDLTIVGIVLQADGEFDVLQAAVIRAGLVEALNGTRQLTVFAPTDLAFATTLGVAGEAAAIAAVNSLPIETLSDILLFHVTNGRRTSRRCSPPPSYQMLNGAKLTRAQLAAAGLAATDISASNGIVHIINAVLLPTR